LVPIQLDFICARDNASPVLARFVEVLQAELRSAPPPGRSRAISPHS
jgi:hypothetical protein